MLDKDSDELINGIVLIPSKECEENLNRYHLRLKHGTGEVNCYYQTNPKASNPIVSPINKRVRFSFGFRIFDSNFFSKYEPDLTDPPQLYFNNLSAAGNVLIGPTKLLSKTSKVGIGDTAKLYPKTFSVTTDVSQAPIPTSYKINENLNPTNTLQTVTIKNPLGSKLVTTKLNDPIEQKASFISKSGPYILKTDSGQPSPKTIYLDDEQSKKELTGVIDIFWDKAQDNAPSGGINYELRFKSK